MNHDNFLEKKRIGKLCIKRKLALKGVDYCQFKNKRNFTNLIYMFNPKETYVALYLNLFEIKVKKEKSVGKRRFNFFYIFAFEYGNFSNCYAQTIVKYKNVCLQLKTVVKPL